LREKQRSRQAVATPVDHLFVSPAQAAAVFAFDPTS
jgi:hypothetical protein